MAQRHTSMSFSQMIHIVIGVSIMLFGRYLPVPSIIAESSERLLGMGFPAVDGGVLISLSPLGMTIVTLFLGVVYLWTFVDTLWPAFLGVFLLGISEYDTMNAVLTQFFGNPMTVFLVLLFIFAAALIRSNISTYLARWLMTRPIVMGRPWVLTGMILLTSYLVAFLDQTSAVFLMWPALYAIFNEVGYKKGDKYVAVMMVNSLMMILLSFASDPVKGGAFYLLSNLYSLAAISPELHVVPLNYASYLAFGFIISLISLFVLLLTMRFVLRVDVSALRNFDVAMLQRDPLPPMSWKQKTILVLFAFYVAWMLLPGILPADFAVTIFLRKNLFGGIVLLVFLLTALQWKGERLMEINECSASYPWRVLILIAAAFLLGGAMTGSGTNVNILMEYVLRDWLNGLDYFALVAATVVIAIIVTNFCNSVVAGIVFAPVLLAICNAFNFAAGPLLACFFFTVLVAAATPAASPFAAMLFDNKEWISKKDAALYAVFASTLVVVIMIFIGMPIANLFF